MPKPTLMSPPRLLALISAGCCMVQLSNGAAPFPAALERANVSLSKLADPQSEALMLGNGDLYGIAWQDKDGSLFMRMTKNDIWDARVDTSKDAPLVKIDVAKGAFIQRGDNSPGYHGPPYPQPRCGVALRLSKPLAAVTGALDLKSAEAVLSTAEGARTSIRILGDRNTALIRSASDVTLEEIKAASLPAAILGETDGVKWLEMNLPGDANGDYAGMDYAVAIAVKGEWKAVSMVTSFDIKSRDVRAAAIALAKKTIAEKAEDLVAAHEKVWDTFWTKSGVLLGDEKMESWWYRMLYFAKTINGYGKAPVALMPPLATDATPWHGDYHFNYNEWQAFWPLPAANHAELTDPWIQHLKNCIPRYRFIARETYDCDGMYFPITGFLHEPDPATSKSVNRRQIHFGPYGLTIGMGGMAAQNLWQKHLCDPDPAYLRESIYPTLKEITAFYLSFIAKCPVDASGRIRLGPSFSPEHGKAGIYNCPFDIAYVRYTFDAFIRASTELGTDPEMRAQCQERKAKLPDYPTAQTKDGKTIVVDWEGCKADEVRVHNITVPVVPVFPGDQVTWFSDPATLQLFKDTIGVTKHNGNNSHVMFNIAKARLGMEEGYKDGRAWFASRELPNGFFKWQGHAHGTYMSEMAGIAGMIDEFLLQSVDHKIRLFPCWPADKDASFTGLRAEGGFLVSASFKGGKVAAAEITATQAGEMVILSPWPKAEIDGKPATPDARGLITAKAAPGQTFVLKEAR
ncbi:MAG: hypothetical protein QM755_12490 [Luteolibacter sp.]